MKKITICLGLVLASLYSKAQGIDSVIVEKYYLANAADIANASTNGSAVPLTANSVTYRVYVDMAPGYKFVQMFGNANHTLKVGTTTTFFNDPNNGSLIGPQATSLTNTKKNTVLIDSWLTVGGVCSGKMGVLKTEDTDGSVGNTQGILANNPGGVFGLPITGAGSQDGMLPGSPLTPNVLGIPDALLDMFDQNTNLAANGSAANSFTANGGAIAGLGGVAGVTSTNRVLIGQFTTDGLLSFELNIQLLPASGPAEVYVASIATGKEIQSDWLVYPKPITTGVKDNDNNTVASQPIISIAPNPTKDVFTITASINKEGVNNSYSVYNAMGSLISYKNLSFISNTFTHSIDLSAYPSGLYFVSVSIDGINSIKKIVKE